MSKEIENKIEQMFNENSTIDEAKYVVNVALKLNSNKFQKYINLLKESKNSKDLYFRIDLLKSILIEDNLIEKKENDIFGKVLFLDCGSI